ncbi:adenosine deaminase-related growth [Rhizopogon vinicolor AM-OR11-026]|uniref:Adenosine deaminase n=1 Tax=Rhizopogon vinicolor AM-OR11-026 TaxID=1314800 RepID=A0A1B7NB63_9AGAM|nr:adenosine deaminase-related growth [Rhizopogon vinicolor AM-OR11-026]
MTSLDEYHRERAQLIADDRALRIDTVNGERFSENARRADEIVRRIRKEEAKSIWAVDHNEVPHPFPGMEFLTGKNIILKTQLFDIVTKMPKGALLHVHLDLTINGTTLLALALQHPSIHIRASQQITPASIKSVDIEFRPLPPNFVHRCISLCLPTYKPDEWVPLRRAREQFDAALGGTQGFDRWIASCLTINPSDAYVTHNDNIRIWDKFRAAGMLTRGLVYFTPIWRVFIRQFLEETIADGVSYVEARINFSPKFMIGPDGEENVPHKEWLRTFQDVLPEFRESLQAQGRDGEFIGAKIIYSIIRNCSPQELEWYLNDCIEMKKLFPDIIAGFDLVGDENVLRPLKDYLPQLLSFSTLQASQGLPEHQRIPFIFHAGETLGDGSIADENLYDAMLLGTKRIGHGFSLVKHPKLMAMCRERGIALEVCPISNEILRLAASMPMHPLPILINHGVPVALSSDDPSMFQNMGLSFDFFQVLAASEVTGLLTLGHIARDSIKYSMLTTEEKALATLKWEERWNRFVDDIVRFDGVQRN